MKKTITSNIIGELIQDDNFPDWWTNENVSIPFFDNAKLPITYMDVDPEFDISFLIEADQALSIFLAKSVKDRLLISDLVYQNFEKIRNEVDYPYWSDSLRQINSSEEIWSFINPLGISITRRPYETKDIFIDISCNCEWEQEHGLQLVFRQGKKLTRVSQIDGHLTDADAYDIPDEHDKLLSEF